MSGCLASAPGWYVEGRLGLCDHEERHDESVKGMVKECADQEKEEIEDGGGTVEVRMVWEELRSN